MSMTAVIILVIVAFGLGMAVGIHQIQKGS